MARKKQYQSIKDGRKATSSLLIVIAISISVLIIGGGGAIYALSASIDSVTASAGVTTQVNVYGNDIIVELIGGDNIDHIRFIRLIIEGYELPDGIAVIKVSGPGKVTYPGFAVGIRGEHHLGVNGVFDNGQERLIFQKEVRFT